MALGDQIRQLDEQVAAAVRRALDDVRDELRSGLEQAIGDLRDRLAEVSPELPESFFTEDALRRLTETAAPTGEGDLAAAEAQGRAAGSFDLREALAAVDRARSQKEILQALVDRSGPFASRAAVLLLRPEGLVGWTARGFDGGEKDIRSVSLPAQGDDWREVIQEGPTRPLNASRCVQLASQLGGEAPTEGVAIPMVLRDRVSAVVYADRMAADAPFDVPALQVLVHASALSLETLAFREREATATLLPPAGSTAAGAETAQAASAHAESAVETPVETAPPVEPSLEEPTISEPPEAAVPQTAEDTDTTEVEAREQALEEVEVQPTDETFVLSEPEESPYLREEPTPEPPSVEAEPELEVEDASLEGAPALESELDQEFEVELEDFDEPEAAEASEPAEDQITEGGAPTEAIPWRTEAPAPSEPAEEAEEAEASAEPSELAAPEERPEAGAVPPPAPPPAPAEPAAEPVDAGREAPETPSSGGPVEPPPDVEGPGLAFSEKKSEPVDAGTEAAHDEARRLARLLVSEIQLYNQEEVAEGRSRGDIYERLKDDIDRSRQLYEERVDPGIRDSTDYFYQELVRQLGAGDAKTLGI